MKIILSAFLLVTFGLSSRFHGYRHQERSAKKAILEAVDADTRHLRDTDLAATSPAVAIDADAATATSRATVADARPKSHLEQLALDNAAAGAAFTPENLLSSLSGGAKVLNKTTLNQVFSFVTALNVPGVDLTHLTQDMATPKKAGELDVSMNGREFVNILKPQLVGDDWAVGKNKAIDIAERKALLVFAGIKLLKECRKKALDLTATVNEKTSNVELLIDKKGYNLLLEFDGASKFQVPLADIVAEGPHEVSLNSKVEFRRAFVSLKVDTSTAASTKELCQLVDSKGFKDPSPTCTFRFELGSSYIREAFVAGIAARDAFNVVLQARIKKKAAEAKERLRMKRSKGK